MNAFALNEIRVLCQHYQQIKSDLERALQKNSLDVQDFEAAQADIGRIRKNIGQLNDTTKLVALSAPAVRL